MLAPEDLPEAEADPLSTPSLGITVDEAQQRWPACRRFHRFQLPLSGSPGWKGFKLYGPGEIVLSTPSLGITWLSSAVTEVGGGLTFNSLSRDHALSNNPPSREQIETFNSLSRDHGSGIGSGLFIVVSFQLPLSGSQVVDIKLHEVRR